MRKLRDMRPEAGGLRRHDVDARQHGLSVPVVRLGQQQRGNRDGGAGIIRIRRGDAHGVVPPAMTVKVQVDRAVLDTSGVVGLPERCARGVAATAAGTAIRIDRHASTGADVGGRGAPMPDGIPEHAKAAGLADRQPLPPHHLVVDGHNDVVRGRVHEDVVGHGVAQQRVARLPQPIGDADQFGGWRVQRGTGVAKGGLHQKVQAADRQATVDVALVEHAVAGVPGPAVVGSGSDHGIEQIAGAVGQPGDVGHQESSSAM